LSAQTFSGVAGMDRSLEPIASVIALITAGGDPMAPASPQPFMPSGLPGQRDMGRQLVGGHIVRARHAVIHVGAGQKLTVSS
jgi:hypothetical protein